MNKYIPFSLIIFMFFIPGKSPGQIKVSETPILKQAVYFDISPPLREMPLIKPSVKKSGEDEIPNKIGMKEYRNILPHPFTLTEDPVWQKQNGFFLPLTSSPIQNFEGINNINSVYPPDTQGDVGLNQYVQVVNLNFAIWNKTGTLLYGPASLSTIWQGIPSPWNGTSNGDPVVLYDQAADRWIISQFSLPNSTQYAELVAISQTADPTGSWYRYVFQFGTRMPDYPKFGVWPDGYYLSFNQFISGSSWGGVGACALERAKMLTGDPTAAMVYFDLGASSEPWSMLPSDWDGATAPITNEPNHFTYFDDWSSSSQQYLRIWDFHVDWITTSNSTFSEISSLVTSPFNATLCGAVRGRCIPQPGTSIKLESLSDRLMFRLQYRNFGTHRSMVTNHTVNVDGNGLAGIRWYELRNTGSGWTIYQQGTYAPDVSNRWVGSIAMNANGDIALGYSVSRSTTIYPSIRYTGRLAGEPLGQMTVAEQTIINGSGSQTGSSARWGDYSMMSVDPADDATFWYTTEYIQTTGSVSWQTRIASFQFGPMAPVANFTSSTTIPCLSNTVIFTDQSSGLPTGWQWSFSPGTITYVDGTSSTSQNPHVKFNAYGTYSVTLTATNSIGSNSTTKSNYISVNIANPDFIASPTQVVIGNSAVFSDASTCNITSWSWNFGDGATPATANTAGPHAVTYNSLGQKTVSLTVNGSYTNTKTNYISVVSPFYNMSSSTVTACTGNFYDSGGSSASYLNNEDYVMVFTPATPNSNLRFTFTSFDVETEANCGYDYLKIYNGTSIAAPLIGTWCGTNSPGVITANNATGSLTFVFHSDISVTGTGWSAIISCISGTPGLWTGVNSIDWNTASNWSDSQVPSQATDVIIPVSAPNWPSYSGNFILGSQCRNLILSGASRFTVNGNFTINAGNSLTISGTATLKIVGNWSNSGIFSCGNGTVEFSGTSSSTLTGGINPATNLVNYSRSTFTKGMIPVTGGTAGPSGDDAATNVNLGFTFTYLGVNYTQARICTNGWISLNLSGSAATANSTLFSATAPNTTLAAWFDDLSVDNPNGYIYYKTEGIAPNRVFIVEYNHVLTYYTGSTSRISFQVRLYETTNIIEYCFGNAEAGTHSGSESASIGLDDATGGSGHFIEAITGSTTTGVTNLVSPANWPTVNYRFTPPPSKETFYNLILSKTNASLIIQPDIIVNGNLILSP